VSLTGTENGLGEIGIGKWAEPNIVLAVGTGSRSVGDGGTPGLKSGEGHKVADVGIGLQSGSFDSSNGSTTVGSDDNGDCKSS